EAIGPQRDALDVLTRLTERSMLSVRPQTGGSIRYELLETLRAYGRTRLDDARAAELFAAHASHFAAEAEIIEHDLTSPDEATATSRSSSPRKPGASKRSLELCRRGSPSACSETCSTSSIGAIADTCRPRVLLRWPRSRAMTRASCTRATSPRLRSAPRGATT